MTKLSLCTTCKTKDLVRRDTSIVIRVIISCNDNAVNVDVVKLNSRPMPPCVERNARAPGEEEDEVSSNKYIRRLGERKKKKFHYSPNGTNASQGLQPPLRKMTMCVLL